jgi:phytoene synthase
MSAPDATKEPTGLSLYTLAAERSSNQVIDAYSTSFGWATRLLGGPIRQSVKNIYALVRVADEIVDGAAAEAAKLGGLVDPAQQLDALEAEVYAALANGFSTNLVVHAFALTANQTGFGKDLIEPFFWSMRQDLAVQEYDQAGFERYIYGSAEVVGLMCLAAFIKFGGISYTHEQKLELAHGARALGSAFQKVNFLRDLAADFKSLGRSYFPGASVTSFDENQKTALVADIQNDIDVALKQVANLPKSSSVAVKAVLMLFAELNLKISRTPANQLVQRRIRVSNGKKLVILAQAYFGVK